MRMTKEFQIVNLLIFTGIVIYFNFTAIFNFGDDITLVNAPLTFDGLVDLYYHWSGRVLGHTIQVFMLHNPIIFRIINSIIMISMPIALWILLDKNRTLNNLTIFVLFFLLYDYKEMRTAGYVSTYVYYYWYLFSNIIFYIFLLNYIKTSNILSFELLLIILFGIFACNSEIGAFLNTIALFAILFVGYYKKKFYIRKILMLLSIPLFSLLFFLTCPGLYIRSITETMYWLPEFSSYTAIYKLYLGFSETLCYYFCNQSVVFMFFLSVLLVCAVAKGINVAYLLFWGVICYIFPKYDHALIVKFSSVSHIEAYVYFAILLCFCSLVLLTIFRIFYDNDIEIFLLVSCILVLGFLTRVLMGFSPTLYASNTRTYLYCDFALLISIFYLLRYSQNNLNELCPVFLALFAYPYFISNLLS